MTTQVSDIVCWCASYDIHIVPLGGNNGLGRSVPFKVDLIVSMTSMKSVISSMYMSSTSPLHERKGPKVYKIKLTHVPEINPEVLQHFIAGDQSHDNTVLTAITALNVVICIEPTLNYPFNGPLLRLCLEYIGKNDPNALSPKRGFPDCECLRLQRFISGIRVLTTHTGPNGEVQTPRVIKKLSAAGASSLTFQMCKGQTMAVADYFQSTQNKHLQFPDVICCEVGSGALIPLELCIVPPGQLMRKQVPPKKTKDVLDFATKKPLDRLKSITNGLSVLAYGQSEYVRQFGMSVKATGPLLVQARVLKPPMLKYGPGSCQLSIKFFKLVAIDHWVVVIYEQQCRFNEGAINDMINGLCGSCRDVGIKLVPTPFIFWENSQGRIADQLKAAGAACAAKAGKGPNLIVVILPEHFGDITMGVATQCLKSSKCFRAKPQYYANMCLKINVKLGWINTIADPSSVSVLTGTNNSCSRTSSTWPLARMVVLLFTALVANVNSDMAKYIAASHVQTSQQETIEELESMSHHCLSMSMRYREMAERKAAGTTVPKRIIFYRGSLTPLSIHQVLEQEACISLNINLNITILVVISKVLPPSERDADRSGNCRVGTVVDRDVYDGLLGTSRPAHYSVLYDSLSFALCHVYACSTRSMSIPAPVYYAVIVCSRAKNHYDLQGTVDFSDFATQIDDSQAASSLAAFRRSVKPLHKSQLTLMYLSFDFLTIARAGRDIHISI
ncbi:ribonuclease H-like domain-containing protein [Mycena capillaripes]|nr:ribonuclease H-like domain-containing protein [Mycena capillaripes]